MAAAAEGVHRVHGYRMTFYAPEPLDVYLSKNRTADGLPFYNTNYACGNPRTGENSDTLMKALEDYCEKEDNKFYEIWRAYKAKGELWSSWQQGQLGNATMDESVDQLKEMVQKRGIGQRRKPVVLYRAYAYGFDMRLNGEFVPGTESWLSFGYMKTEENQNDRGYIARPTDQRLKFGILFQDYMPNIPNMKLYMNLVYNTGLPGGSPSYADPYVYQSRLRDYRRADVGFSYVMTERIDKGRKAIG